MRGVVDKRGQIWVETVIYTLIGLAIIGLVLAAALPKINEQKDKVMIEQSIEALNNIDDKIVEVQRAVANRRVVDLDVRKGALVINTTEDTISWILDSSFPYSEEDVAISIGRLDVNTSRTGGAWQVELKVGYSADIQYGGKETGAYRLEVASTPYKFLIENNGLNGDGDKIIIDLSIA